jgi:hypothetical protein
MVELEKGTSLVAEAAKDNRRAARALVSTVLNRPNEHVSQVHYPVSNARLS